jgi:choline dehydrogenase-like flavoprotein
MGTTRMADDPKQGVTDPQGRVHGIDNLYIAGSSLFPTSGWANPTLTIAALSLRMADHIAQRARNRHAAERAVSFA